MLREKIGPVDVDHMAYEVQPGRMDNVLDFFLNELGWSEDIGRQKMGLDWGEARFIRSHKLSPVLIQLTDAADRMPGEVYKGIHLGMSVPNALIAAGHIVEWTQKEDYEVRIELANDLGTKVFVYFPELITFGLELISKDHECD